MATALSAELRDPSNLTFDSTLIAAFINAGVIEIGRLAPARFQQDVTVVADTLTYAIQTGDPEVEVQKIEVWDVSTTPDSYVMLLPPLSKEYTRGSGAGWYIWNGTLYIPNGVEAWLVPGTHLLRVWGYTNYAIVSSSTEMPMSTELEYAVKAYAKVQALESMIQQRNLFTQWSAQPGNTDVTPASLLNQLSMAHADWERTRRKITLLREAF